jgi:hypothetical protein
MTSTEPIEQAPYVPRHARPSDDEPAPVATAGEESDPRTPAPLALDPEWVVLQAIPAGKCGSAVDHLAIGPGGVVAIDIKDHPDTAVWVCGDTFKVDRRSQRYVRNSRLEAQRIAKLLSERALFDVDVHGLLAVRGAERGFTVKEQPADGTVTVLTYAALAAHLRSLPVVLGPASIARIHAVAEGLATWRPKTVEWSEF